MPFKTILLPLIYSWACLFGQGYCLVMKFFAILRTIALFRAQTVCGMYGLVAVHYWLKEDWVLVLAYASIVCVDWIAEHFAPKIEGKGN